MHLKNSKRGAVAAIGLLTPSDTELCLFLGSLQWLAIVLAVTGLLLCIFAVFPKRFDVGRGNSVLVNDLGSVLLAKNVKVFDSPSRYDLSVGSRRDFQPKSLPEIV
jgi:hypothetical protein